MFNVEEVIEIMSISVTGICKLMTLMKVLTLLLGFPDKLFWITSAVLRTFLVFFDVNGELIINSMWSIMYLC